MFSEGMISVDDGEIFCVTEGDGPAVVLLHGGTLNLRMFDPQIGALSENYRLVRMDLRGYGRSSMPSDNAYRHCDDVAAVLDHLEISAAVVGGESFGGSVSLDFAFAHGDRLRGLIFEAAGPITGWQWVEGFPLATAFKTAREQGLQVAQELILDSPLLASAMRHKQWLRTCETSWSLTRVGISRTEILRFGQNRRQLTGSKKSSPLHS